METSNEILKPLKFSHLLVLALDATKLPRSALSRACAVLPRTVARWVDGDCEPNVSVKTHAIHALHESGRLPKPLLDALAENIGLTAWQLGYEAPPRDFTPTPATRKVLGDVVREAAEDLGVGVGTLRPVLAKVFAALEEYEIPARAAAAMVVERR
jgi:hypothetical protein